MDAALLISERPEAAKPLTRLVSSDGFLVVIQLAALWSLWNWLGTRLVGSGGLAWEMLPLVSVVFFAWANRPAEHTQLRASSLILAAITLGIYSISTIVAAPFIQAMIGMVSLTFVISRLRFGTTFHPGVFTLLVLCLPVTDSLNFYLGYPMRAFVGEATVYLLNLQGLIVYREGVNLHFGHLLIAIDAPCSGIKMLWFGILLAANLSFLFRLSVRMFLPVLVTAFALIVLGNVMRASALFYIEGGLIEAPAWMQMHSAVGVVAFAFTSVSIGFVVMKCSEIKWQR